MESNINVSESCLRSLANVLISWEGKKKKQIRFFTNVLQKSGMKFKIVFLIRIKIFSS